MPDVVGIRVKRCGKVYDFEIGEIEAKPGDHVVVESDFGLSLGQVIRGRRTVEQGEREFKKVLRPATEEDFRQKEENKKVEKEARAFCLERIMARGLLMKLVSTEVTLDRKRIVFYFTADGRIDFRELVKDLAARFKTRIEMRQIGVRDEAKLVGGFGVCGLTLCCNTFLTGFEPVSIKMAKKQEMVLNVGKLSGLCSRLMCCLRYEYDGDPGAVRGDDEIHPEDEEKSLDSMREAGAGAQRGSRPEHGRRPEHQERRQRPHRQERPERPEGRQRPESPDRQGQRPERQEQRPERPHPQREQRQPEGSRPQQETQKRQPEEARPEPAPPADAQPQAEAGQDKSQDAKQRDRRRFRRKRFKK